tara:strand:- start:1152 stop:2636 length:1485 start_codon:yes stop_codon:yes gene_type:complete
MIWILSLLLIPIILIIYIFIYKFINNRKFSKKNGFELILRIIKSNKVPIVFLLESNSTHYDSLNFIKSQLKSSNLNYLSIDNLKNFDSFYKIYNNLFEAKFIIFVESLDNKLYDDYIKNYYDNILIFNIDNNCKSSINKISTLIINFKQSIDYLSNDVKKINVSSIVIFNELELAYKKKLLIKKPINRLNLETDSKNIIIPVEYFLFSNDVSSYLGNKSIFKDVYLKNDISIYKKLIKIKEINSIFNGINDSYDFKPNKPTNFNFTNNRQLFNFLNNSKNLIIYVDEKIILNRDSSLIIYDLKKIFNFEIKFVSVNSELKIHNNLNYIIICIKDCKIVSDINILVYNSFNFNSLLNYVFSKTFEIKINSISDKNSFFNKFGNDLLIINKNNLNKLGKILLKNFIWVQDLNFIDLIEYLKIISFKRKTFIHIVLDKKPDDLLLNFISKLQIKFIIYLKHEVKFNNVISLEISQININNLKEIVNQSKKGLLVKYY